MRVRDLLDVPGLGLRTRVLGRRRLLLSAVAEGAGLDAMFRLMGQEIGAECWLLTATGRVVGGTGPSLPEALAVRLAGEYLKADRLQPVLEADLSCLDDQVDFFLALRIR